MPRKVVRDKEKPFNAGLPIVGSVIKTVAEIGNIPTEAKQKLVNPVKAQRRELRKLLRRAQNTAFGQKYRFQFILHSKNPIEAFRRLVPVFDYDKMHDEWWYRNLKGERNVAWPGKIKYFALSSGTASRGRAPSSTSRHRNTTSPRASTTLACCALLAAPTCSTSRKATTMPATCRVSLPGAYPSGSSSSTSPARKYQR